MYHGMAIWTYRTQVTNGIDSIVFLDLRQRNNVVDMYVAFAYGAIPQLKIKSTNRTFGAMVFNAFGACC
jgi:hypothetical protein